MFVCLFAIGAFSKTGVYTPRDEKNSMLSHCGEKRSQAHSVGPSSPLEDVTHTKWILFPLIVIMWHSSMESNTSYDSKVIARGFGKMGYDSQPVFFYISTCMLMFSECGFFGGGGTIFQ